MTKNAPPDLSERRRSRAWPRWALLLASAASALTALSGCQTCGSEDRVFLLGAMQGAKLQPLIAACVDPAQKDCLPLCQMLIQSEGVVDKCQLRENRDGYTEIVVRFSPSCE